jgi:dipeptidyl aminopeptidase/acylaminoacyl peptidase
MSKHHVLVSAVTLISILFASVLVYARQAQKRTRIPVREFFKNPDKAGFQISPNGEYISFMQPYQSRLNIFIQKRGSREAVRITSETARDIAGYFWKGDGRIVYIKDFKGDENYHIVVVDRDGKNLKDLTPFDGVRASIIDALIDNDNEMIIGLNRRNPQVFDVFRLNVINGDISLVAENPGTISTWKTDHAGKVRVAVSSDGSNDTLLYREDESSAFKPVVTTNFRESIHPLFFTFDNKYIYASSNIGRDKSAIIMYDIANGKEMNVLYAHQDVDVQNLNYSRKRKILTTILYTTWKTERTFLDPVMEKIFKKLRTHLPHNEITVTDMNRNEDLLIVRSYGDRSLGSCFLYDVNADKLTKLADISPWLKESEMCEMKPVTYKARDGIIINGYLTLPRGVPAKNLPVVINPHGGPWARDSWGFKPEVQFLANRGYAVLQMNYRGSTGYGRAFWESSFKQWGKKMQDDISDGVGWLIQQGVADPKRIAIYGGSYGGYATLAGLTFTPDLYACGVDYVGVSNLFTFMQTIPPYWKPFLSQMYEMVGDPEKDADLLRSASPVFFADKIRVPLFVAQGAKDPRVNINESNQIVDALRKRGVAVEYMVKENEGHGFHNEENRFDFYEAMEKFLSKYLGNK